MSISSFHWISRVWPGLAGSTNASLSANDARGATRSRGAKRAPLRNVRVAVVDDETSAQAGWINTGWSRVRDMLRLLWSRVQRATMLCLWVGAVVASSIAARHLLLTTSAFSLNEVIIEGNHQLSANEIMDRGHLAMGRNLFSLSLKHTHARLLKHPWIRDVEISRKLPHTLTINVVEHEPYALLMLDHFYLVSSDGQVYKQLEKTDRVGRLPVISGVDPHAFSQSVVLRYATVQNILSLIHAYRGLPIAERFPIKEVRVGTDGMLSVDLMPWGTQVYLGAKDFEVKLKQVARVLNLLQNERKKPEYIDVVERELVWRVIVKLRND